MEQAAETVAAILSEFTKRTSALEINAARCRSFVQPALLATRSLVPSASGMLGSLGNKLQALGRELQRLESLSMR